MADYEEKKGTTKPFTLFNNTNGQSIELPVLSGTDGPDVLDIRSLYKKLVCLLMTQALHQQPLVTQQ